MKFFLTIYIAMWQYSYMAIEAQADHLSLVFAALADPTRRAILARLASGNADVSELMKPFDLRQPTISKHLSVLERAGLVVRKRDAQRRPRTLAAVPLRDVADWVEPFSPLLGAEICQPGRVPERFAKEGESTWTEEAIERQHH